MSASEALALRKRACEAYEVLEGREGCHGVIEWLRRHANERGVGVARQTFWRHFNSEGIVAYADVIDELNARAEIKRKLLEVASQI